MLSLKSGCVDVVNVDVDVMDGCMICRQSVGRHGHDQEGGKRRRRGKKKVKKKERVARRERREEREEKREKKEGPD